MDRRVEWSDKALGAYQDIIFYYKKTDSKQAALNFQSIESKLLHFSKKGLYL